MRTYLVIVPVVWVLSLFGPGFLVVRRFDWRTDEKITAALGLSILILYFACFGVFVLQLSPDVHWAILAACAVLTLGAVRGARPLAADPETRRLLAGFALSAVWILALLALVRSYSGGHWYGDWYEHYERSRFFLGGHDPAETFQGYALPARPPLANVVAAHVLALGQDRFRAYQLTSALLSLLVYFPACLIGRLASRSGRLTYGVMAAFLMFNPLFVQNATYSWTKLPAAFFVLSGTYFYIAGWRFGDPRRIVASFIALGAGVLTHYSSCTYALFLALHYLLFLFPARAARWKELLAASACTAVILGSWLGWVVSEYGARAVVASVSSVQDRAGLPTREGLGVVARNLRDTLVPHLDVGRRPGQLGGRPTAWSDLRDILFNNYQQNLFLGLGFFGWALLLYDITRTRGSPAAVRGALPNRSAGHWFWAGFAFFNVVAGTAAHPTEVTLGLAHVVLQPLILLGIAFLASRFVDWGRAVRWLAIAGLAVDVAAGVLLHFWFQSTPPGAPQALSGVFGLSASALRESDALGNWRLQADRAAVFVGNDLRAWAWLFRALAAAACAVGFFALARQGRGAPPGLGPSAGAADDLRH
jgi:hypothetical protein